MKTIGARLGSAAPQKLKTPAKEAAPVYRTAEHRGWAATVVGRAGGLCLACGASGQRLYADHVVEIRDGGSASDPRNGQALCGSCHGKKTARARRARHALASDA